MRHPEKRWRDPIDPWAFARARRVLRGALPLWDTREIQRWGDGEATIAFTLEGRVDQNGHHRLSGALAVRLTLVCQRCLAPMNWPLVHRFDYVLIRDAAGENAVEENDETLICAGSHLDPAWFLEEEVLLVIPMTTRHENCEPPAHAGDAPLPAPSRDNPFAALAALKNLIENKEQP